MSSNHSLPPYPLPPASSMKLLPVIVAVVTALGAAVLVGELLQPFMGNRYAFITFMPALAWLAWWRGAWACGPATLVAAFLATLLYMEPRGQLTPLRFEDQVGLALFILLGGLISLLGETQGRAIDRARRSEHSQSLLAAIVQSSDDAIISKSTTAIVMSWNRGAERLYGYTADEMIGRSITTIVPDERQDEQVRLLDSVVHRQQVNHLQTVRLAKDGRRVHVSLTVSPVHDRVGNVIGASETARDIGAELEAQEALRASEQRFRSMADSSPVMIWMAGVDKGCSWLNRPWLEFTGRTLEEELGDGWLTGVHPEDQAHAMRTYRSAFDARQPFTMEYRLRRRDGVYRWLLDSGVPVFGPNGRFDGFIGSCMDITALKEIQAEKEALLASERAARSEAERLGRVKDDFVATLSHELRTPLNAMLGWVQLIRRPNVTPDELAEGLEVIGRNTRAQARMIEDLLDMSRVISGKLRLDVQTVNMVHVVEQAIVSARPAAEAKRIRLQAILDPRTNMVNGDPTRLQQIIWNLLSNAIKFTQREGRVQVVLKRVDSAVQVVVSDTGRGIKPEFLDQIFERFRQEDSSITRRFGGLGLGLAIVKHLTELHGGTVSAASDGEGRGATFTVELPLAVSYPIEAPRPKEEPLPLPRLLTLPVDHAALSQVKVLVVDDEADSRTLISRILRDCGAEVHTAESTREAIELFRKVRPRVVLSDIGMPQEDGYELIRQIRALNSDEGNSAPAVALTALARSEDRTRALLAGFQVHMSKPVEPAELIAVVSSLAKLSFRPQTPT